MSAIKSHRDLIVYQIAYRAAVEIYRLSKQFPPDERYSLTDQIRRSSRSVPANLAEAYRKRRYEKAFISKLSDAEGEAAETQVWLDFARSFQYMDKQEHERLYEQYDHILGKIVLMVRNPQQWSV